MQVKLHKQPADYQAWISMVSGLTSGLYRLLASHLWNLETTINYSQTKRCRPLAMGHRVLRIMGFTVFGAVVTIEA